MNERERGSEGKEGKRGERGREERERDGDTRHANPSLLPAPLSTADTLRYAVTLTFDPLTLNVYIVSAVT